MGGGCSRSCLQDAGGYSFMRFATQLYCIVFVLMYFCILYFAFLYWNVLVISLLKSTNLLILLFLFVCSRDGGCQFEDDEESWRFFLLKK